MIILSLYILFLIAIYKSAAINLGNSYLNNQRENKFWGNEQLRDRKPQTSLQLDELYKPKSYDAYMMLMRNRMNRLGNFAGYKCGNVKQMIKDGKLLMSPYFRYKKAVPLEPLFPSRKRRAPVPSVIPSSMPTSGPRMKIKDEIDSIKIYPVETKGSKTIECHKDTDEIISCIQDDLEYKIRLRHKDLSQESLESLIRTLFLRLSSSVPSEKRKRSEAFTVATPEDYNNAAPFMIVLPPPQTTISGCNTKNNINEDVTSSPFKSCKTCDKVAPDETAPPPIDQMVIECNPNDFESANQCEPSRQLNDLNATTKHPSAYIYSCRWQGKRQVETQNIVVPLNSNHTRTLRQSFRIVIDPSEASTNTLPISITL